MAPFISDPAQRSIPTSLEQGTLNKSLAFSQYPHNIKTSGVAVCPFFCNGGCRPAPGCQAGDGAGAFRSEYDAGADNATAERSQTSAGISEWMGFSVRDLHSRYTVWVPYNGSRAQWPDTHPEKGYTVLVYEELYDEGSDMSNFDSFDTANLAYQPQRQQDSARYYALVRNFFHEIQPPVPSPPPPPPKPRSRYIS